VGSGTANPVSALQVNGTVTATAFSGNLSGNLSATNGNFLTVGPGGTAFNHIEDGVFAAGSYSGTNGCLVATNAFKSVFSSTPMVMVCPAAQDGTDYSDGFSVTVRRITSAYFVVNIYRLGTTNTTWAQALRVSYHAWQ